MSNPQTKLGQLITNDDALRDAVHIAVAPVIAFNLLMPGTHIGLYDGKASALVDEKIGIVDPFLSKAVQKGQQFWMFLYPNTITDLKHVWTHPAFKEDVVKLHSKSDSEAWLRNFVENADFPPYEDIVDAVMGISSKEYYNVVFDGNHIYSNGRDASGEIPSEFWNHMEIVTGKKISQRPDYFSCSC